MADKHSAPAYSIMGPAKSLKSTTHDFPGPGKYEIKSDAINSKLGATLYMILHSENQAQIDSNIPPMTSQVQGHTPKQLV